MAQQSPELSGDGLKVFSAQNLAIVSRSFNIAAQTLKSVSNQNVVTEAVT